MTQDSNQERDDQILLETDDKGNVVNQAAEQDPSRRLDEEAAKEALKRAAKVIEKGGESDEVINTVASGVYAARSMGLQALWDSLGENAQRNLIHADDRNTLMRIIEKYFPSLDYRRIYDPVMGIESLRNVLSAMAMVGLIDVAPEIRKDMRGMAGVGLIKMPDIVITGICSALGKPEVGPILLAVKRLGSAGEHVSEKIRARVDELKEADELKNARQTQHGKMDGVLPDNLVPMHPTYPPDEEGEMAA